MQVEIWSDVMCPFCYIGKRKIEAALEDFEHKNEVEIIWKSFQLNPDMKTEAGKSINQYLAEAKGWSLDKAKEMNNYVTEMAKESGLTYNMDKAVVANSFDAHRVSHLAKKHGLQDKMEERIFAAYFTEGKNTADHNTLAEIGEEVGMDKSEILTMLAGNEYATDVEQDIYEAQQVGVRGVPFYVLGRKYAVSGAQPAETFLQALNTTWSELANENKIMDSIDSAGCTPDGCDPA